LGGLLEIIMGGNQTEFGEVGSKAVREVVVEKKTANWGDGRHVHTHSRHLLNTRGMRRWWLSVIRGHLSCTPDETIYKGDDVEVSLRIFITWISL
jgi:hypothetical protein